MAQEIYVVFGRKNVGKTILNHPPVMTIFIGGINHAQMGG